MTFRIVRAFYSCRNSMQTFVLHVSAYENNEDIHMHTRTHTESLACVAHSASFRMMAARICKVPGRTIVWPKRSQMNADSMPCPVDIAARQMSPSALTSSTRWTSSPTAIANLSIAKAKTEATWDHFKCAMWCALPCTYSKLRTHTRTGGCHEQPLER